MCWTVCWAPMCDFWPTLTSAPLLPFWLQKPGGQVRGDQGIGAFRAALSVGRASRQGGEGSGEGAWSFFSPKMLWVVPGGSGHTSALSITLGTTTPPLGDAPTEDR